jgi:membrane protein implicated in regulation of membrane protease activity
MLLSKRKVLSAIKKMPDKFSIAKLFDRIILLEKIEEGRLQIEMGKTYATAEARKKLKK